jgi:ribulose-5-phosphate 4-epimerase/fuculose-1-phosphate aldolase
MAWLEEKKEVLAVARRMLDTGLVTGTAGNVSRRLTPIGKRPLLAITPGSRDYYSLSPDDIQILDFNAKKVEGDLPPSVEILLHIGIYRARKDINAIVHTHSVFASAAAVAGLSIPPVLDEQVAYLGGEIKLADYAPSGTPELAKNAAAALGDNNAVLLANHGAVGVGSSLAAAFHAAQLLEKTAQVFLLALAAAKVNVLTPAAQAAARAIYDKSRRPAV